MTTRGSFALVLALLTAVPPAPAQTVFSRASAPVAPSGQGFLGSSSGAPALEPLPTPALSAALTPTPAAFLAPAVAALPAPARVLATAAARPTSSLRVLSGAGKELAAASAGGVDPRGLNAELFDALNRTPEDRAEMSAVLGYLSMTPDPEKSAAAFAGLARAWDYAAYTPSGPNANHFGPTAARLITARDPAAAAKAFARLASALKPVADQKWIVGFMGRLAHPIPAPADLAGRGAAFAGLARDFTKAGMKPSILRMVLDDVRLTVDSKATATRLRRPGVIPIVATIVRAFDASGGTDAWWTALTALTRSGARLGANARFVNERLAEFLRVMPVLTKHGLDHSAIKLFTVLQREPFAGVSDDELARVLALDDYVSIWHRRPASGITASLFANYRKDPAFLKLRFLLADGRYDELKAFAAENGVARGRLEQAIFLNQQNRIITQATDLVLGHAGTKGILTGMVPLRKKIRGFVPFTRKELKQTWKASGLDLAGLDAALKTAGLRYHQDRDDVLVVPAVFDVLTSAYRGSAEHDHAQANYLTHSLTTAIVHYANKGGEAKGSEFSPYGSNAFHEFDLGLLALVGRKARQVDPMVALAFEYKGLPLPDYARKRTVRLISKLVSDHIAQMLRWQTEERRASGNLLALLERLSGPGLDPDGVGRALDLLDEQLRTLKSRCGLRAEYYEAVYGGIDAAFGAGLRRGYRRGRDNAPLIRGLLARAVAGTTVVEAAAYKVAPARRVPHPWLKSGASVLDYLRRQETTRRGTFEESDLGAAPF